MRNPKISDSTSGLESSTPWLRDETKGLTLDDARKPMLSRIFLWYAGDFETRGGSPAYAAQYAPAGAARDALATTAPGYFAYDWNLNTQ